MLLYYFSLLQFQLIKWSFFIHSTMGELSGRVLDSRPRGHGIEPHRRHCAVSMSKAH